MKRLIENLQIALFCERNRPENVGTVLSELNTACENDTLASRMSGLKADLVARMKRSLWKRDWTLLRVQAGNFMAILGTE